MNTKITAIVLLMTALSGKTQNDLMHITVNAIQQKNPFISPEELSRVSAKLADTWPTLSSEQKQLIINFLNYSLPGPSTMDTRTWAGDPIWNTGTSEQIKTRLLERADLGEPIFWSGSMNYSISGPASFTGDTVPTTFRDQPPGNYILSYISGGPPNASFAGISDVARFQNAGEITRNFHFKIFPKWRIAIETQPTQPTYGDCPMKESGKENLIVVTHGWNPDIAWLDSITNAITKYLAAKGLNNWQVHAHKWVEKATISPLISFLGAEIVLRRGRNEGNNLGKCIANQGWGNVHLIGHSAGAGLIQASSETIKDARPETIVHTTFLDPFVGLTYGGKEKYGKGANWSDSYFSKDAETVNILTGLTGGHLDYAYNVDVTLLDPNKTSLGTFRSSWDGNIEHCYQTVTSHEWPHEFYFKTVEQRWVEAQGFGFPLSKEGGNWDYATNQYKVGNNPSLVLGTPNPSCAPDITLPPPDWSPFLDFSKLLLTKSSTGALEESDSGFTLTTGSPSWLAITVEVTNALNLLSFEASFSSDASAEGLLSVYWDTNELGLIDEQAVLPGIRQYAFPLPRNATNDSQTLGFRLDAFSAIQSSVTITNVALGFAGVREPFSLSFTGASKNGLPILQLTGPAGFNYAVESSTNLVDWKTMAILVNTNGFVRFVDPTSTNAPARFYRAVAP